MEGKRSWWGGRISNPVEAASVFGGFDSHSLPPIALPEGRAQAGLPGRAPACGSGFAGVARQKTGALRQKNRRG